LSMLDMHNRGFTRDVHTSHLEKKKKKREIIGIIENMQIGITIAHDDSIIME